MCRVVVVPKIRRNRVCKVQPSMIDQADRKVESTPIPVTTARLSGSGGPLAGSGPAGRFRREPSLSSERPALSSQRPRRVAAASQDRHTAPVDIDGSADAARKLPPVTIGHRQYVRNFSFELSSLPSRSGRGRAPRAAWPSRASPQSAHQ